VARPRRETGRPQESMVEVVMNARARGVAKAVPPMKMFRPYVLVREFPTGRRIVFNGLGRWGSDQPSEWTWLTCVPFGSGKLETLKEI
jgi:hypothetical protein